MTPVLDPKAKFLNTTIAGRFVELTSDRDFQDFLERAYCEMATAQRAWATPNDAAVFAYKLAGAKEFIGILNSLPRPEESPSSPQNKDNLPWNPTSQRRQPPYPHQTPPSSQTLQVK